MKAALSIGALAILGVVCGVKLVQMRNELVRERDAIAQHWDQVDAALAERAEQIPKLIETVSGPLAGDRPTVDALAGAWAALGRVHTPREKIAANGRLDNALASLLVAAESYPALKTNQAYLRLQDDLAAADNAIADVRRKYNEAVQRYNTDIELFPRNLAAALFGFHREDAYFHTEGADSGL